MQEAGEEGAAVSSLCSAVHHSKEKQNWEQEISDCSEETWNVFKHCEKSPSSCARVQRAVPHGPAISQTHSGQAGQPPARFRLHFPISRVARRTEASCAAALMFLKLFEDEKHYK